MTDKHVNWAKDHDWCQDAYLVSDGIRIIPYDYREAPQTFNSFSALKEWAGY